MNQRTGILGGTFDPVHNGHLALAEAAGQVCDLDEILLLPAAVPPHKKAPVATFSERSAMLEIALKKKSSLRCLPIEQFLPVPSFTIDTLRYLQLHSACPVDFYFIIGADAFLDIPSWKEGSLVMAAVNFIVFSRTGIKNKKLTKRIKALFYKKKNGGWFNEKNGKWIYCSFASLPEISSSMVRQCVANRYSIKKLVPSDVVDYIASHALYSEG